MIAWRFCSAIDEKTRARLRKDSCADSGGHGWLEIDAPKSVCRLIAATVNNPEPCKKCGATMDVGGSFYESDLAVAKTAGVTP
jgi:hypothetical protein